MSKEAEREFVTITVKNNNNNKKHFTEFMAFVGHLCYYFVLQ